MAEIKMWTSKLGNKYPMDVIQAKDASTQMELKRLRKTSGNLLCADCGSHDNSWASVTHGVFICIVCSDVHRSVGTHITKMKGCTGTYLWGPDEVEKMLSVGNRKAEEIYGDNKVSAAANKAEKQRFVEDKYAKLAFAGKPPKESPVQLQTEPRKSTALPHPEQKPVRLVHVAATPLQTSVSNPRRSDAVASESLIPDSFFDDLFGDLDIPRATSYKISDTPVCANHVSDFPVNDWGVAATLHAKGSYPPVLDLLA